MNSEELELSLRSEFENYLKSFRAEIRQEAAELQRRLDEAFQAYAARFDSEREELDEAFKSTVVEHLRLARDEGAKLTATALAEAEQMDRDQGGKADFSGLRDAVANISSQTSQSAILRSLVTHAAAFAPRGAFFIIKNEHFAGWKVFGGENESSENAVREIHFPMSSDTILGRAVASTATVDSAYGAHKDDEAFLDPLQFGRPDRMYAIPLVARGRGVAVMYADYGTSGTKVNLEALETLVRIAGVTVELLAASQTAQSEGREAGAADFEQAHHEVAEETVPSYDQAPAIQPENQPSDFAFSDGASTVGAFDTAPTFSAEPAYEEPVVPATQHFEAPMEEPAASPVETFEREAVPVGHDYAPDTSGAVVFDSGGSIESAAVEKNAPSPFETTAQAEPAGVGVMGGGGMVAERGIEVSPASAGHGRLSDRPVDLPIDVAEDERRLHNDARRFARLLVSEIKLYNEKKVQEGRLANDLYERLREAIDRSREMYDKRVQPPVASKFDYFHYELVNALADGDVERLGSGYPGSAV